MKRLIIFFGVFFLTILSAYANVVDNPWDSIKERTWFSVISPYVNGEQIVFYESKNGFKKAIVQLHGSGVWIIQSFIYDVDFRDDTICLSGGLGLKDSCEIGNEKLVYRNIDSMLVSIDGKTKYKKLFNESHICNWQVSYLKGEVLQIEKLKEIVIQRKKLYPKNSFTSNR